MFLSLLQLIQRQDKFQNNYDTSAVYQLWNLSNGEMQKEHFQPDPLEQSIQPRETLPHSFIYCLLHEENTFMGDLCFLL